MTLKRTYMINIKILKVYNNASRRPTDMYEKSKPTINASTMEV